MATQQLYGWCGPAVPASSPQEAPAVHQTLRSEAAGYFAMVAFLSAYLLNVAGAGHYVQAALNFSGAVVAAFYLHKKRAVPSVISNLAWVAITVAGLLMR
jgi:hypothetical protein